MESIWNMGGTVKTSIYVEILLSTQFCDPRVEIPENVLLYPHQRHPDIDDILLVSGQSREDLPFVD